MEYTLDTPKIDWKKEATRTLSNKITLARICGTPFFLILLILSGLSWFSHSVSIGLKVCTAILALALWISDGADGYIARKRKEVTLFGAVFDPAADKIFIVSSLLVLVFSVLRESLIRLVLSLVLILMEAILVVVGIKGYRLANAERISGRMVGANIFGKVKLNIESALVFSLAMDHMGFGLYHLSANLSFWVSLILIVLSIVFACLSLLGHSADLYSFLNGEGDE